MNKRTALIGIGVAIVAIIGVVIFIISALNNGGDTNVDKKDKNGSSQASTSANIDLKGLVIDDLKKGDGNAVKEGDTISINYTVFLSNGKKAESSFDTNAPLEIKVGSELNKKGLNAGVVGMKVGGKRKLTVPPELGYGAQGAGKVIPPNETLTYEIELVSIKK